MGKKGKGRVARHATRAKSAHEGSDAEESESGALSGTSSEKQRLFETRAQLREAKQESLRLTGELAEDDEVDEDDDDDYDDTHAPDEEDELATLRTANAALLRRLKQQRRTGTLMRQLMSVRLLLLLPRPSLVMRFKSTTLLSMIWKHPLQTSRSSGRSLRPNVKPILIVQTPPPMPPLLALLTSIFRTRTDPHIFNVFRNAQITLRILLICESYPFLVCLCFFLHMCLLYIFSLL